MEELSGITSLARASDTASRTKDRNQLTGEDFTALMIAQLQHQDPTSPVENSEMLQQQVAIRTITSQDALRESLTGLVEQQEFTTASNIIGKLVSATRGSQHIEGLVDRVQQDEDGNVEIAVAHNLEATLPNQSIGREAFGYDVNGNFRNGTVERVSFQNGTPFLVLTDGIGGEASVPFANITKLTSFVSFNDINAIASSDGLGIEE